MLGESKTRTAKDIEFSSDRNDYDSIYRLHRVVGFVQGKIKTNNHMNFIDKIHSLDDHGGTLTVTWLGSVPEYYQEHIFNEAWEAEGNYNVVHIYKDVLTPEQFNNLIKSMELTFKDLRNNTSWLTIKKYAEETVTAKNKRWRTI